MQLVCLIDFFKDDYNIVRDRFETDPVNEMKNRLLVANKHKEIKMYINMAQSHQ